MQFQTHLKIEPECFWFEGQIENRRPLLVSPDQSTKRAQFRAAASDDPLLAVRFLWSTRPHNIGTFATILFTAVVIAIILDFILKSKPVSREIIYAAILLYLLVALMWAHLYTFLELVDPASLNIDIGQANVNLMEFKYYSFVTITTLGYGDIIPVTEVPKDFSVLEAVVGQLYLVVAVAWLVGMHVSSRPR